MNNINTNELETTEFNNNHLIMPLNKKHPLHNKQLIKELRNDEFFKRQREKFDKNNTVERVENLQMPKSSSSRGGVISFQQDELNVNEPRVQNKQQEQNINRKLGLPHPLPTSSTTNGIKHKISSIAHGFPTIRRAAGQQHIDAFCQNNHIETTYDFPVTYPYQQSLNCNAPQSCGSIFQSLQKPPLTLDQALLLNIPWSTASTPCVNTPRNRRWRSAKRKAAKYNHPYRTVSHFGFNSPTRLPTPEHKHLPTKLERTSSYEELVASPRYIDLCDQCYEQLVQLKSELIPVRTRLRNLADYPAYEVGSTTSTTGGGGTGATGGTGRGNNSDAVLEQVAILDSAHLETVQEVDEKVVFDDEKRQKNLDELDCKQVDSFVSKINSLNYSEESTNAQYEPPLTCDSVLSVELQQAVEKAMEAENVEFRSMNTQTNVTNCNQIIELNETQVEITEVLEFGNWMETDGVQACQYRSNLELAEVNIEPNIVEAEDENSKTDAESDSGSGILPRGKRLARKLEFQEIWDDHVNFFQQKETINNEEEEEENNKTANNTANTESFHTPLAIDEVVEIEDEEQEVFLGCSVIVHNISSRTDGVNTVFKSLNSSNISMTETAVAVVEKESAMTTNSTYLCYCELESEVPSNSESEIKNNMMEMITHNTDDDDEGNEVKNIQNSTVDDENSELSWGLFMIDMDDETAEEEEEAALDASDEISFNSIEREILQKIETNDLKSKCEIFNKIDKTIRTKLTPKRLAEIMQNSDETLPVETVEAETENIDKPEKVERVEAGEYGDEKPTTSAKAEALKNMEIWANNDDSSSSNSSHKTNYTFSRDDEKVFHHLLEVDTPDFDSICSNCSLEVKENFNSDMRHEKKMNQRAKLKKKTIKGNRRNFIRENIKNASKTTRRLHAELVNVEKKQREQHNENIYAIFCKCPFGDNEKTSFSSNECKTKVLGTEKGDRVKKLSKKRVKNLTGSNSTSSLLSCDKQKTSPVYSFQKDIKYEGPNYFWMSMSPKSSAKKRNSIEKSTMCTRNVSPSSPTRNGARRIIFLAENENSSSDITIQMPIEDTNKTANVVEVETVEEKTKDSD